MYGKRSIHDGCSLGVSYTNRHSHNGRFGKHLFPLGRHGHVVGVSRGQVRAGSHVDTDHTAERPAQTLIYTDELHTWISFTGPRPVLAYFYGHTCITLYCTISSLILSRTYNPLMHDIIIPSWTFSYGMIQLSSQSNFRFWYWKYWNDSRKGSVEYSKWWF